MADATPRRAHRTTRLFPYLQGFLVLPWLLPVPILLILNSPWGSVAWVWALLASIVVAVLSIGSIGRWYSHHYGEVRMPLRHRRLQGLLAFTLFIGLNWLLPIIMVRNLGIEGFRYLTRDGPIAWPHVLIGLMATALGLWLRPAMPRFWVFCLAILVAASLPLGAWWPGLQARHPFFLHVGGPFENLTLGAVVGSVWILAYAFLSHRALTRLFPPPSDANTEDQP